MREEIEVGLEVKQKQKQTVVSKGHLQHMGWKNCTSTEWRTLD